MDLLKKLWAIVSVQQDSTPELFNWKDIVHAARMAAGAAAILFLKDMDAANWGLFDKLVTGGVVFLIASIEAWKVDNS